ncbi:MAG: hypothetical protein CL609_03355 [Anaerolineaceae bacterium]|nr:hypothetical protein [Anaerolineaceae bacterium]
MQSNSKTLQPLAVVVAILLAAILISGIIGVPYRSMQPPTKSEARLHLNTKNSTRFGGASLEDVSTRISTAVYPDIQPETVFLFDPQNWQAGLAATTLLRPMKGVLLPMTENVREEVARLNPTRNDFTNNGVVLLDGVQADGLTGENLMLDDILGLRQQYGLAPQNVILVDKDTPETALLAAPWAAYSGDLIIFDAADAPTGLNRYSLGVQVDGFTSITAKTPEALAVTFAKYEDPQNTLFGWAFNANTLTGYRAYIVANPNNPAMALAAANLAIHGKPGPLMWSETEKLPAGVNNYFWSQRAAFWVTPAEGPFHHFWIIGDENQISFKAQGQADYAVEIGPYFGKGVGLSGIDLIAVFWVLMGMASAIWILLHQFKFLPKQNWVMSLAWPLLALLIGPFGLLFYYLAYRRPIIRLPNGMIVWDRPLWLQGLAATVSAVGFGASIMITSGYLTTFFGMPLIPNRLTGAFLLGTPMILLMIINFVVAVLVSWLVFQTPMMVMFTNKPYKQTLGKSLPIVLISMTFAAVGMNPLMWYLMMSKIPMMPTEESILWFGVMFFTAFTALLAAWPLNYVLIRKQNKSGLM